MSGGAPRATVETVETSIAPMGRGRRRESDRGPDARLPDVGFLSQPFRDLANLERAVSQDAVEHHALFGVAVAGLAIGEREEPLAEGHGFVDQLLSRHRVTIPFPGGPPSFGAS